MKERVMTFGSENNLVGVYTEPDQDLLIEQAPCVLILNSGILHHVGPFRLHVHIARKLAEQGCRVFRLDVGGIGDSPAGKHAGYDDDRVVADIRAAMDVLSAKKSLNRFVLMGLCTGAANSHKTAVFDERVVGGVFLDGYAYPTRRFYLKRYLPALMDSRRVKNAVVRNIKKLFGGSEATDEAAASLDEDFGWWNRPPKHKAIEDYTSLVSRGVDMLYIYTGDQLEEYNYQEQFVEAFPMINFKDTLQVIMNREADHTYIIVYDRDILLKQITQWMQSHYLNKPSTAS